MAGDNTADYWTLGRFVRRWPLIVGLALLGVFAGGLAGYTASPTYTAEARLAVGSGSMSDLNIPGFPTASAAMAANYARWVTSVGVVGLDLPAGTTAVTASPFPESNVVRLEATSSSRTTALEAVNRTAKALQAQVNAAARGNDPEQLLTDAVEQSAVVSAAQTASADATRKVTRLRDDSTTSADDLSAARAARVKADGELARASLVLSGLQDRYRRLISQESTEAQLNLVGTGGRVVGDDRVASTQRLSLLGLGLGLLVSLVAIRVLDARGPGRSSRAAGRDRDAS